MRVQGVAISTEVQDAAARAMVGKFQSSDVRRAIARAGLDPGRPADYLVERVADRIMQRARKRGEIKAITNKVWLATTREVQP